MLKLAKVSDERMFKENNDNLLQYLDFNIDATVCNTLRLLGEHQYPVEDSLDNQSSLENLHPNQSSTLVDNMFNSEKIKTRA